VFVDRDGTLTEEVGYVNHPSRVRLLPGAAEAVRVMRAAGRAVVVVTNQAGVGRGYLTPALVAAANAELERQLAEVGTQVDAIYVCQHHPADGCECRKPKPGLILRAAADLDLDLTRSTMVGDKPSDIEAAAAAGMPGILVLTGLGRGEWEYRRAEFAAAPDHVAEDLLDAARHLC
jgi:D-glycero-D-manno-heptose 1,7-bisphosphate phosphatase